MAMNIFRSLCCLSVIMLTSCVSSPPKDLNNACHIFRQYPSWYRAAKDVERRWKIPVSVQMAIIHQESHFDARARPRGKKVLWLIPGKKLSSAYGYTQALDGTWALYKQTNGSILTNRQDFSAGVDFIGWYANQAFRLGGIPRTDAYRLYLAYHEGIGGYRRKTYLSKVWLIGVARKVKLRAQIYQAQLKRCRRYPA